MPDDDKKKEIKKEGDALKKLMKEVQKKIDRLMKLGQDDTMFTNMLKMQKSIMKKHDEATMQVIKNMR